MGPLELLLVACAGELADIRLACLGLRPASRDELVEKGRMISPISAAGRRRSSAARW
jgi:hypothetical protein